MPALVAAREGFRRGRAERPGEHDRPDARVMRIADGGFCPACNVPFATDCDSGLVLTATD